MRVILCLYSTEGYYPQARVNKRVNKNVPILMGWEENGQVQGVTWQRKNPSKAARILI